MGGDPYLPQAHQRKLSPPCEGTPAWRPCPPHCLTCEVHSAIPFAALLEAALEPGVGGQEMPSHESASRNDRNAERVKSRRQGGHKKKDHNGLQELHGGSCQPAWLSRKRNQNRNCRKTSWSVEPGAVEGAGSQVSCKLEVLMS